MSSIGKDRTIAGLVVLVVAILGFYNIKGNKEGKINYPRLSNYIVTKVEDNKAFLLVDVESFDKKNSWFIYTYKASGSSVMLRNKISYEEIVDNK